MQSLHGTIRFMSRAISNGVLAISIGFLVLMLALVIFQVVARYGINNAPAWTEEAARYAMIWCGLFGVLLLSAPILIQVLSRSRNTRRVHGNG